MKICFEVTWPVCTTVCLQGSDDLGSELRDLGLRNDLVRITADRICVCGLFGSENMVPDVYRYEIVDDGQSIAVRDHRATNKSHYVSTYPYIDRPAASDCHRSTLVVLLESPHRDEYGASVAAPIAPARGATGERIHKYLFNVLNSCDQMRRLLLRNTPGRVVISNPIPFQASAYSIHGGRFPKPMRLRELIWPALWSLKDTCAVPVFQREFLAKLNCYDPIAIVNACTSGQRRKRRSKVTDVLREWRSDLPIYESNHPSTWDSTTKLIRISDT